MSLDLRKLEHLVAVAEEGGFTRAAERLHLSQQALSTSIRTLERHVGVQLLDRGHQHVTPTPAGQALIEDARALNAQALAALDRARRIGRGRAGHLRVGHTPAVTAEEVVELLTRARTEEEGIQAHVRQLFPDELREHLLTGACDVGLSRAMPAGTGLTRARIAEHRLRVAVPAGHPLADRASVALADLRDQPLTVWGEPGSSAYTDLLIGLCRQAGVEPDTRRNPVQGTPPVTAVTATGRIAFVTTPAGPAAGGAARVVDLDPPVRVPVHALWPTHTTCPGRDLFLSRTGSGDGGGRGGEGGSGGG
ncbi:MULTISPECIES: LysR family transcriptional regulator [Streptomyces]|uniref:LysR family transcriptional regulator n=1 Tax=Streptomyces violaceoruber TaxID=1935 RepID=A0A1V0UBF2_STRVN|nr:MULTISPECIES: LysR family transcriptional regulator [Streptomyces]ARF62400.1 LysR family transcriptional regulator [Streptomyces violaceoruber]MDW4918332.1 LysR family transcriptional regulator [Streptomyces californicus]